MKELAVVIQVENGTASVQWQGGEKYEEVLSLGELLYLVVRLCRNVWNKALKN